MSIKRQLGGKKAKRNGQSFERNLIIEASYQDFAHIQIPDGCRQLGFNKLIRVKSPFDFVFVNNKSELPKVIFFDAKSTLLKSFPYDKIKAHQLRDLLKFQNTKYIKSGYIINFENLNKVVFFSAEKLRQSTYTKTKLTPELGIEIGHKFKINLDLLFDDEARSVV